MSVLAVIPARYASSRFPGKPLTLISGKPMIQWVVEQAKKVPSFDEVIVATDDPRILQAVLDFDGKACLTSTDHQSGTDRCWEVAQQYPDALYVFNIQGDEPLINPNHLEEAVQTLKNHTNWVDIITMKTPIDDRREFEDTNIVKVVTRENQQALYFSRSPIPMDRDQCGESGFGYRHIGVYGFQRHALEKFVQLPISKLEQREKIGAITCLRGRYAILCNGGFRSALRCRYT